ncbi:MAG TPA: Rieske 2Fe-2S domain-containing protein [Mucilaginibacter sp.]|nr:Rieske 2Fe-2S domain-containing protein [Mucilaginibacter sp.]
MERQEFLSKLGLGLVIACTGCGLASCGSKSSDPTVTQQGTPPPVRGSGPLFSIDLATQLTNVGDSKVSNRVILVRIGVDNNAASFTAVQVACTHEGTSINYNTGQNIFICPLHGSEFSQTGQVLLGPASSSLQRYTVAIVGDTLTVSA